MSNPHAPPVEAAEPNSPVRVRGTDHITVEGTNLAATIEFYRDLLGMPLVLSQPNLDRRELTHLFFDTGDGRMLTFFACEEREASDIPDPRPGQVHHLAFRIDGDRIEEIAEGLRDAGYPVSEYDRGVFHSLYTRDINGLGIELVADKFGAPDDRRGEVVALAHQLRLDDGAEFVEDRHMRDALERLGLEAEDRRFGDAPTGRDG